MVTLYHRQTPPTRTRRRSSHLPDAASDNALRGFSLIELMIVITVVTILGAMLLPALSRTRAKSLDAQCLSVIGRTMSGISLFAADHDDRIPFNIDEDGTPNGLPLGLNARNTWANNNPTRPELGYHIAAYVLPDNGHTPAPGSPATNLLVCPAFVRHPQYASRAPDAADVNQSRRMFRLRQYVEGDPLWTGASPRLSAIQNPSANGGLADLDRRFPGATPTSVANAWSQLPDDAVHGKTRNYGFFDARAAALPATPIGHQQSFTTNVLPSGWLSPML
jgi:prepilin-type N-terminal cleavage/methylation domain-containing protein